jgi:hypothetical protein
LTSLSPVDGLPAELYYLTHNAEVSAITDALRAKGIPVAPFH